MAGTADSYGTPGRGQQCSVCVHVDRPLIEVGLARGVPLRVLARRFSLHKDALHRHRHRHLPASLVEGMRAARAEADPQQLRDEEAEGLLGHFVKQRARLWRLIDETEALGSFRDVIAAHGKLSDVLKAEAQLLGQVGGVRTVNLYVTPEWVALRAALVQALAAHPEARQAVAAVLRRVEVPALEAGETR